MNARQLPLVIVITLALVPITLAIPLPPPRRTRLAPPPLYHSAPPPRVFANPTQPTQYENLYRSYLEPLGLFVQQPEHHAPVRSPRGRDRLAPSIAAYQRTVNTHPAYVAPGAGEAIPGLLARAYTLTAPNAAPGRDEQRAFLALFNEVGEQSRLHMQNALHPENVSSQHRSPLESLRSKYAQLLQLLERDDNSDKLTGQLSEMERQSFERSIEMLQAEHSLLQVAKGYASTFPHL